MTSPFSLDQLLEPVQDEMASMREVLARELGDDSGSVRDMVAHVSRFRGKQLRAALVLLCGRGNGNFTGEHPKVAAVVELIHLATLVHDDVLDGAQVRRRVASVNERWDNQTAVLLGDLIYARAFHLSTTLSSGLCSRLLSVTTQGICRGEIEQACERYHFDMAQDRYEAIAGAKTALLYAAACELGAGYPSGDNHVARELRQFGYELGLAFQIIDDLLDLTGEQAEVGKSVGNDVEDGKVTLAVLHTYSRSAEDVRAAIRDSYTLPDLEDRRGHLRSVCDLEPGLAYARARAEELMASAFGRLTALPESEAKSSLEQAGEFILSRRT